MSVHDADAGIDERSRPGSGWAHIPALYVVFGTVWIIASDIAVHGLGALFLTDATKGLAYVAVSGVLVGWLAWRAHRAWHEREVLRDEARRRADELLHEARDARRTEARLVEALHHSNEVVFLTDESGAILFMNQHGMDLLGGDEPDHIGRPADIIARPEVLEIDRREFFDALQTRGTWSGWIHARTIDRVRFPAQASVWRFDGDDEGTTYLVVGRDLRPDRDLDNARAAVERLDRLTQLPHRATLRVELERTMAVHAAGCVVVFDVDAFRGVNQTAGVTAGDGVLVELAARMQARLGDLWGLARIGADEFAAIGPCTDDLVDRVRGIVDAPFDVDGDEVLLTVRTGRARWPLDADTVERLLTCAEFALDAATAAGAASHRDYDARMHDEGGPTLRLTSDLRRAIRDRALEAWVQPQFTLGTGALVGFEVLARWTHPTEGPISPARFVQMAEDAAIVDDLTICMLERAIDFAERLPAVDGAPSSLGPRVAINLSPLSLGSPAMVERILATLDRRGFDPRRLEVELTETALVADDERAARSLNRLAERGVTLAIDDFGTGYSSLALLARFRGHRLKLDRSFVSGLPNDARALAIVRTVLALARTLGLETVGEGVETEAQRDVLIGEGCDLVQGYLTGRPMPADEAIATFAPRHPVRA